MIKRIYKVIIKHDQNKFEETINEYLDQGWMPVGGVSYQFSGQVQHFTQSLMLETEID